MPPATGPAIALAVARAYHQATKHHFHRFAAALGYLDWASQPDPFRRFSGAPVASLPLPAAGRELPYWQLFVPGAVAPAALDRDALSLFFRYALSLTAWKRIEGSTWSLRANPSSGNLHPTEGYAILPAIAGISEVPGIHHYAPREHALERRADLHPSTLAALLSPFVPGSFLVALSSIHWREAWKYGERAFRYCQHDVGHALGALSFAAAALGWRLRLLDAVSDAAISRLLGLDRTDDFAGAEREHPDLVAVIEPFDRATTRSPPQLAPAAIEAAAERWYGQANVLSPEHGVDWPAIDEVALATTGTGMVLAEDHGELPSEAELFSPPVRSGLLPAERVILGRRSAVRMDGATVLPAAAFFRMLGRLVPARDEEGERLLPWDAVPWRPRIHLALFVHRVSDVVPGLYALARDPARADAFRRVLRPGFHWRRPPGCPPGLPLFLLEEGDCSGLAVRLSCDQDIAGDGAFSLAMIAELAPSLAVHGAAFYRHLFWEAGLVGQVLYLEAEEAGIRSTGIGCYYDDPVHEVLGIAGQDWQSLYHFTVGGPVEDVRLTTLPAYPAASSRLRTTP